MRKRVHLLIALVLALSLALGVVAMPVAAAVHESFSLARASQFGGIDFSGIADVVCELAKIDRPRVPEGWKPS